MTADKHGSESDEGGHKRQGDTDQPKQPPKKLSMGRWSGEERLQGDAIWWGFPERWWGTTWYNPCAVPSLVYDLLAGECQFLGAGSMKAEYGSRLGLPVSRTWLCF